MLLEYKTDRRGYAMWLERDLIGSFVLYRRWYGLHNRRGGMKRQVFEREQDALKEVRRIIRLRERHGYVPDPVAQIHLAMAATSGLAI